MPKGRDVDASAPRAYWRVTLASASTLSRSVVRTLRVGGGLPIESHRDWASPQVVIDCLGLLFAKGTQWVCGGVEKMGVGFQQWSMTGLKVHKDDRIHTIAIGFAILRTYTSAVRE